LLVKIHNQIVQNSCWEQLQGRNREKNKGAETISGRRDGSLAVRAENGM